MIIFEMEKEDIKYVDRIGELADMCIVIDNPKSFSSELNTVVQIGVELAPYAISGVTLIIIELIKNRTDLFSGFWERPVLRKQTLRFQKPM